MRSTYTPADAYGLLSDRKLIAFACDVTRNKAFAKADARTEDAYGHRVADYVASHSEREAWPARVEQLLRLPAEDFESAMRQEPVKLSEKKKPNGGIRLIGIPTFTRRCCSNAVKTILSVTGDHLLPPSARAYRPGSQSVVKNAVLDVADAVSNGRVRFWAKLDFSAFFAVMPWSGVEGALQHYGYEREFIAVVMALVRCPLVRNKNGRCVSIPHRRGAQMGLPESATLANLLPFALDEHFERLAGRLLYIRYSDDVFIGAAHRSDVVGGVRAVQHWCRAHGIAMKGVSSEMNAQKLVHDVKNSRIALLGAEIDANGEVHLPLTKLKDKLADIQSRYRNLARGGVVQGVSRYGDGGGTHRFDVDDVNETVVGFLSYWRCLDERGTRRAKALINKTFPLPVSPRSGGQGVAWIARLWGVQAGGGVEVKIPAVQEPTDSTDAGLPALTGGRKASGPLLVGSKERNAHSEATPGLEPVVDEAPAGAGFLYTDAAADLHMQDEEEDSDDESLSYGAGNDDSLCDAEDRKIDSFSSTPTDGREISLLNRDRSEIYGAVDDPPEEPPLRAVLENMMVIHVVAERVPQGPRKRSTRLSAVGIGVTLRGALIGSPSVSIVAGRRESAAVREILSFVSGPARKVVVAMADPWLAKVLLQPHRRLRSPMLYALVVDVHREAERLGLDVVIVGGVAPPTRLREAVELAIASEGTWAA